MRCKLMATLRAHLLMFHESLVISAAICRSLTLLVSPRRPHLLVQTSWLLAVATTKQRPTISRAIATRRGKFTPPDTTQLEGRVASCLTA